MLNNVKRWFSIAFASIVFIFCFRINSSRINIFTISQIVIAKFTQSFAHFRLDRAFASSFLDTGKCELIDRWITYISSTRVWHLQLQKLLHYNLVRLFSCRHIHLRCPERFNVIIHCTPEPLHARSPQQDTFANPGCSTLDNETCK